MRGRDAEWLIVHELLRRAQRRLGGVLLVEGQWGMGKSLLLRESGREAAGRGFSLAAGAADPVGRLQPLFALLTALHDPLSHIADGDLPDTATRRIGQLRGRLKERAAAAPVLVILDDLQWASPATLLALRILPRELARYPIAWILARSYTWPEKEAGYLFSILERDGAARVELNPLGDDAVVCLLTDVFGAPPDRSLLALATDAAGNPALLSELMHGLVDENAVQVSDGRALLVSAQLPQRIDLVARQRLDGLSRPARNFLETAAVLGRSFPLEDVAQMLGDTPAALLPAVEEAIDAGIVIATEDAFSFHGDLMWHAVASMIPPPARKAMHHQVGELLLKRGCSAVSAADHLLEAAHSSDPATLAGLDSAAAETLPSCPQTAATLRLRAVELTPPTDPDTLVRSVAAAEALTAAGNLQQAARIVHRTLAQPLPPVAEARLRCALSSIRCTSGQAHEASVEAQRVLAQPQVRHSLRDQAIVAQLQALAGLRDNQAAERMAVSVLADPGEYGDQVVEAALVVHAMITWDEGRISEGLGLLREAARNGSGLSPDARQLQPLLALAAGLVDLRQFDQVETILRTADSQTPQGIPSQAVPAILRARVHLAQGRLSDATAESLTALATAQALAAHGYTSVAYCVLGEIALRRGDLQAARQYITSRPVRDPHFADCYARTESIMAEVEIVGARDGPGAAIDRVRDICTALPLHRAMLLGEPAASAWLVRVALAAGDHAMATEVVRVADALSRDNPEFPAVAAAAAHSLGLLDRDPVCLAQAAAQYPEPWARASAAEDLGVLWAMQADKGRAVHHMGEAINGYIAVGAAHDEARIRRRLRRLGVRRRFWTQATNRPASGWESLTETERATSDLVAQGLSNRQIADQMYISVHTVTFHLRQTFRKLDIGSRVELTRIVLEKAQHSGPG